jgi:hypothetical protein
MSKRILDRRTFLATAGKVAAGVVLVSGTTTILAANRAWAMSLKALAPYEAEVLLRMTRLLYPHDMLGDVYYAEVVEAFDAKVAANQELAQQVKNGVAALDSHFGVPWLNLSEGTQLEALTPMQGGESFFQAVRGHTVVALYNNKNLWPNFGYPGSSAEEGGYLFRGFQDAGWTLEPDAEASPPAFTG